MSRKSRQKHNPKNAHQKADSGHTAENSLAEEQGRPELQKGRPNTRLGRILTFAGSTLVLATFLSHDYMRERVKDAKDKVTSAADKYDRMEDQTITGSEEFRAKLDLLNAQNKIGGDTPEHVLNSLPYMRQQTSFAAVSLDGLRKLAKALGNDNEVQELDRLRGQNDQLRDKNREIMFALNGDLNNVPADPAQKRKVGLLCKDYFETFSQVAYGYSVIAPKVLAEKADNIDKAEARLAHWTATSVYLYILGWGITLVGNIVGVKIGAAE
jgi:hypothetical protein